MNTWRPFANGLVSHTFEDFQKKFDDMYTSTNSAIQTKEKFDPETLFPFKIPAEDIETRFQSFKVLKQKVEEQRGKIKRRDLSYEARMKEKEKRRRLELKGVKEKREKMMSSVRKNNEGKGYRNLTVNSQRSIRGATFEMTQISSEKSTKMPPLGRRRSDG